MRPYLEKLPIMLAKLQRMTIDFLNVLQAAHCSFLEERLLDTLPQPTRTGSQHLAGARSPETAHAHSYTGPPRSGPEARRIHRQRTRPKSQ